MRFLKLCCMMIAENRDVLCVHCLYYHKRKAVEGLNKRKRLKYISVLGIVTLLMAGTIAASGAGGTAEDPVVTKGYIEQVVVPQMENYVNTKVADAAAGNGSVSAPAVFTVVNMAKGQKLLAAAGTELILRMGTAAIIATEKGGLADTTSGVDLSNGSAMPSNHLLIVPVADGRGITANEEVIVMVKGGYTLQ